MFWTNDISELHHADARSIPLPDKSVHCVVTSPPYWGLRNYSLGGWTGGDPVCSHERRKRDTQSPHGLYDRKGTTAAYGGDAPEAWPNNVCGLCGAVQTPEGIGLEPTLDEHIDNIVAVSREIRRVLRDDGTFWLNYGDAYAGSWGNYGARNGEQRIRNMEHWHRQAYENADNGYRARPPTVSGTQLAPKNLIGLAWRVAFALQEDGAKDVRAMRTLESVIAEIWAAYEHGETPPDKVLDVLERLYQEHPEARGDGWILRSAIVWFKPNPMPESVQDRPTGAYEMVFLFTKSNRPQFWTHCDLPGTRTRPASDYCWIDNASGTEYREEPPNYSGEWIGCPNCGGTGEIVREAGQVSLFDGVPTLVTDCAGCASDDPELRGKVKRWKRVNLWRGHDYFYDAEAIRDFRGDGWHSNKFSARSPERHAGENRDVPISDQRAGANIRNVWPIPTQSRKDSHFATFPDELPRRCILAGTSEHGVCAECGAPWERKVDRTVSHNSGSGKAGNKPQGKYAGRDHADTGSYDIRMGPVVSTQTLGWRATCDCGGDTVPATVLDPFVGSGTTCATAQSLGRRGIGLDLNEEYLAIARRRIKSVNGR